MSKKGRKGKKQQTNITQNSLSLLTTKSYFSTVQPVLPIQTHSAITKSICTTDSAKLPIHRTPTYTHPPASLLSCTAVSQHDVNPVLENSQEMAKELPHAKRQTQEPVLMWWCASTTSSSLLGCALTFAAGAFKKTQRRVLPVMEKSKVMSLCFCNQNIWSKVTRNSSLLSWTELLQKKIRSKSVFIWLKKASLVQLITSPPEFQSFN